MNCNNCGREHGPIDECLIGVIASILEQRGHTITAEQLSELDVDRFWVHHVQETIDGLADALGIPPFPED